MMHWAMGNGSELGVAIGVTACGFLSGSIMFSYLLGRLARRRITDVGDGNPGAVNLWKAAGYRLGIAGILLDFLKGYAPMLWAVSLLDGNALIGAALAPILGHAFSPFLRGKGGKAIAVTFGVWSALTAFEAAFAYAVIMAVSTCVILTTRKLSKALLRRTNAKKAIQHPRSGNTQGRTASVSDGFQVVIGMLLLGVYLYVRGFSSAMLWVWAGNLAILVYKHRLELAVWKREASEASKHFSKRQA